MKRTLLATVPWMVLVGAAHGQIRAADVLYLHQETTPQRAYRVGDECFVPLETAQIWGWKIQPDSNTAKVSLDEQVVGITLRTVDGKVCLPLRKTVELLGGSSEWQPTHNTLQIFSELSALKVGDGRIQSKSALPAKPFPFYFTDPGRAVVDLVGVRLSKKTELVLPKGAKAFQYRANVVRVVVDTPFVPEYTAENTKATRELDLTLQPSAALQRATAETPKVVEPAPPTPPAVTETFLPMSVGSDSPGSTQVRLAFDRALPSSPRILRSTATTLEVAIPGVQATLPGGYLLPSAYVPTPIVTVIGGETVLKFTFPRATGVQIANEGNTVLLNFLRPNIGRAGLAGRVIVIDPGHGGKDSGSATGGIQEKNITLAVSRAVADELAKAGATVVMTRQTDVFIPLLKRNEIAAHNNAEFFVSIHVNQTSGGRSGSLAFYHGSDPVSRLLGQALLEQLAQNSGIPTIGTWSDLRLYDTGLSVLRNSRIPAVLLELGFISNQSDRQKMVAADFPGRIAKALVQGFRTYLGDARE